MSDRLYRIPDEFLQKAKCEEINMIRKRVDKRKKEMIHLIKRAVIKHCSEYEEEFDFDIARSTLQDITNNITLPLSLWDGGRKYQSPITDYKQAHKKVRTYWNREKPGPLGDELFSGIIGALFLYVMTDFDPDLIMTKSERLRLLLFVDIFEILVDENIKFDKSMRRPLILHACFFKSAKFKQVCIKFIACFGLKWDHSVQVTRSIRDKNGKSRSEYVRNENRSQDLHDSFVVVLRKIRSLLNNKMFVITVQIREKIEDLLQFIQHSLIQTKTAPSKLMDDNKDNSVLTITNDINNVCNIYNGYGPSHGSKQSLSTKRMRFHPYGYNGYNGYNGLYDQQNLNQHDDDSNGYHEMKDQFDQYNPLNPSNNNNNVTDTPTSITPTSIAPITQPLSTKSDTMSHDYYMLPSKHNQTCWHFPTSPNNNHGIFGERVKYNHPFVVSQHIINETSSFPEPHYVAQHQMQYKPGLFNDQQYQHQYQQTVSCCCLDLETKYKQNVYPNNNNNNNCDMPPNPIYVSNNINNINNMNGYNNNNNNGYGPPF